MNKGKKKIKIIQELGSLSELGVPEPWAHQKEAIQRARSRHGFALFFEQGTGKTRTVIEILKEEFNLKKQIRRTIIFTPPVVVGQFQKEWYRYSQIEKEKIVTLTGSGKKRVDTFLKNKDREVVFITNYQSLQMEDLFKQMRGWGAQILVFDESHKIKSISSKTSKLSFELSNPTTNRPKVYLLSGTPVLNSELDIFQQFKVMLGGWPDQGKLISNYYEFRAKFFYDKNLGMPSQRHFPDYKIKTQRIDGFDARSVINETILNYGMRVTKEDCLDLPDEVSVNIKVKMSKEQEKAYLELKKDLVTYINDKACVAPLAIVKALRLMEVTSGYLPVEGLDKKSAIHRFKENPKEEALRELLEEITEAGHKVLVWCVWRENYETVKRICEAIGTSYVEIHGDISPKQKELNLTRFKNESGCKVFIGHPSSGGVGLNLIEASYSIFYSRTFSLEHYLQATARNHRGGQTKKVTHYQLLCENTIDELVLRALQSKEDMSEKILDNIKKQIDLF